MTTAAVTTDAKKQARWWWFTIQLDSEAAAIAWVPQESPQLVYVCWRAHAAPTTEKPHVHVLAHYKNGQKFGTLQNKGYSNLKFCTTDQQRINRRQYCITDVHKDGSPKNPLAPFQEKGEWTVGQGARNDLVRARTTILGKRKWSEVLMDDSIIEEVCKYGKWVHEIFAIRPEEEPPIEFDGIRIWQHEVLKVLDRKPKKREIIWIWSAEHETGKSTFKDYLLGKKYEVLSGCSRMQDTLEAFDGHSIIWFDCAKTEILQEQKEKQDSTLYYQLEKLSNMTRHTSPKYQSKMKLVWAHVVVSSNEPPPIDRLPKRIVEFQITAANNVLYEDPAEKETQDMVIESDEGGEEESEETSDE